MSIIGSIRDATTGATASVADGKLAVNTENLPVDGNNPSLVLAYTDGNLTSITKTIGATSYLKTLTYTDGVLTGSSAWSEI